MNAFIGLFMCPDAVLHQSGSLSSKATGLQAMNSPSSVSIASRGRLLSLSALSACCTMVGFSPPLPSEPTKPLPPAAHLAPASRAGRRAAVRWSRRGASLGGRLPLLSSFTTSAHCGRAGLGALGAPPRCAPASPPGLPPPRSLPPSAKLAAPRPTRYQPLIWVTSLPPAANGDARARPPGTPPVLYQLPFPSPTLTHPPVQGGGGGGGLAPAPHPPPSSSSPLLFYPWGSSPAAPGCGARWGEGRRPRPPAAVSRSPREATEPLAAGGRGRWSSAARPSIPPSVCPSPPGQCPQPRSPGRGWEPGGRPPSPGEAATRWCCGTRGATVPRAPGAPAEGGGGFPPKPGVWQLPGG